jgi:hypothetical protein
MLLSLKDYHERMFSIIETAENYLEPSPPSNLDVVTLCRTRMARMLTSYHLFAQREIFEPQLACGDFAARVRTTALANECASLANDFRAYSRLRSNENVLDFWPEYRAGALGIIGRVRQFIARIEAEAALSLVLKAAA